MSISVDRFASEGTFSTYDPHPCWMRGGVVVVMAQCHHCGYEAPDPSVVPPRCPKCGCSAFEFVPVPGSLLRVATENRIGR